MAIRIPRPSDVLDAASTVAGLPSRTVELVDDTVRLMSRMGSLVDQAQSLLTRADRLLDDAENAVTAVVDATRQAQEVIARADATTRTVEALTERYAPIAERAAPLAQQFVEEFSEHEVHAAIRLIDQLPPLAEHLENDIMPILATLDRVGPDVHELLEVTRDLRQAIVGMPGFAFFRRRGEDRDEPRPGPAPR